MSRVDLSQRPAGNPPAMEGPFERNQIHWGRASAAEREVIGRYLESGPVAADQIQSIKKGQHREVIRLRQGEVDVHIKRNELHNFRARARRWLRPSKAQLEFDLMLELAEKGLSGLEPLAWAEAPGGHSVLVTRTLADGIPLDRYWAERQNHRSARERGVLFAEVARLLSGMHDMGWFHPDPHPGNLLWNPTDRRLVLMDLHTVRRKSAVSVADRIQDLAAWGAWSDLRLSRGENLLLLKRYHQAIPTANRSDIPDFAALCALVRTTLDRHHRRFWDKQAALCLRGGHRRFEKVRLAQGRGMALGGEKELMRLVASLPAPGQPLPADCRVLKESKSSRVFRLDHHGRGLVIKQVPWKRGLAAWLGRLCGWDPVTRAWYWTQALRLRLLPTPKAYGHVAIARGGYSVLALEELPQAVGVDAWASRTTEPHRLRRMVWKLARVLAQLHERGLQHRDLKAANLLVDDQDRLWLVDLVGVQKAPTHPRERETRRMRDLSRIAASFRTHPALTLGMRLRFLKTYLFGCSKLTSDWKVWWRAIADQVAQRVERTQARGRPLG